MKHMLNLPRKVYFRAGSLCVALRELPEIYGCRRAYLVTDTALYRSGAAAGISDFLHRHGLRTAEFFSLDGTVTTDVVESALSGLRLFEPDVILGFGGGAAMTAAKALWLRYENPTLTLAEAAASPEKIVSAGKAKLVLVASNFATGAQNTPFSVLEDEAGAPLVIKSFSLLPEISVTDADFTAALTAGQVRAGARALAGRILCAFTDERCDEFTQGLLSEALAAIAAYTDTAAEGNPAARERLHNAGAIAGAALGNVLDAADLAAGLTPPRSGERLEALCARIGFASPAALYERLAL